jgi:hypothetical protein
MRDAFFERGHILTTQRYIEVEAEQLTAAVELL